MSITMQGMEIKSLAENTQYIRQVAEYYHDEWVATSSTASVSDVESDIRKKIGLKEEIPHFYVAVVNDTLVGVVELKIRENSNYPDYLYWLGGLYVNPQFRGQGAAGLLVDYVKRKFADIGVAEVYLQCEHALIEKYKKYGFVELHPAKHGEIDTTIMLWKASHADYSESDT